MKTKAAILYALNQPLEIWDLEIPKLARGQVLVEIAYSGVCRTQLNEIKGYKGPDNFLPHTLGHEGSGVVLEVGEGVSKVHPGDVVVLSWIKGSGIDAGGCKYGSDRGWVNSGPISTFLEYAVISENRVVPIPKNFSLKEAALLGCAIPTGAGIVINQLKVSKGCSFAVFGTGGIGLSSILAARFFEADPIVAIDINDEKLAQAKLFGATHLINTKDENVNTMIKAITEGKGIDRVMECVGRCEAMEVAFEVTATNGICVIAGNLPKGSKISIDPFDLILGKQIKGSWGGSSNVDADVLHYIEMAQTGNFCLSKLITHEESLKNINKLLSLLEQGLVGRAIVVLSQSHCQTDTVRTEGVIEKLDKSSELL